MMSEFATSYICTLRYVLRSREIYAEEFTLQWCRNHGCAGYWRTRGSYAMWFLHHWHTRIPQVLIQLHWFLVCHQARPWMDVSTCTSLLSCHVRIDSRKYWDVLNPHTVNMQISNGSQLHRGSTQNHRTVSIDTWAFAQTLYKQRY